ncbi:hypothetical protein [Williamsia sterculiae]|uniref:Uncharacterized protein n=1 Tax=Williamsia sterculiae TaxID=1344003 RepID=A0A1N7FLD5_9NOCA|nr:hypothetical protein [Williamsia sterculiae]SIS01084.1 hypothetical protein SAMN05445060_2167 [Williamsia sterculiae]
MTFPHQGETAIGRTDELQRQEAAYEAAQHGPRDLHDHAVGGSQGTADGA